MPNRILRDGILTSERIARLAWAEEVFYRRLMSVVDDFGRYYANPALLRAALYPLQIDKVSDSDIGKWLTACVNAALVRVYPASDGKRYLELQDFRQQLRAKGSRFPAFDERAASACAADAKHVRSKRSADAEQPPASAHLDGGGDGDGDGGGGGGGGATRGKRASRARASPMPDDFAVSDAVRAWAEKRGYDALDEHLDAFRRKAKAKGYTYVDWDAAFMEAIREDWAKVRAGSRAASQGGRPASEADEPAWRREQRERNEAALGPFAARSRSSEVIDITPMEPPNAIADRMD